MRPSRSGGRQRLGQHFLRSPGIAQRIVAALGTGAGQAVVEIGPGEGALTEPLAAAGFKIFAVEKDPYLARATAHKFKERATVVVGDGLDFDFEKALAEAEAVLPLPLIGNLPYESATPMIRRFVRRPDLFSQLVVMVQKEVGDRMAAVPGTGAYGFLTLDITFHAEVQKLFEVSPGSFSPPPQVLSSVLRLVPKAPEPGAAAALALAALGFHVRRKVLPNALQSRYDREAVFSALDSCGISRLSRAEALSATDFVQLANALGNPTPP